MTGWKGEKGAILPLVGLALIVIVLLVGLAVDLGHVHNVKIELQRAVDAAALAGAHRLVPDDATAEAATDAAVATAEANTVDATLIGDLGPLVSLVVTPGQWDTEDLTLADRFAEDVTPYNAVQVTATMTVEHFFFFPFDPTISADAIAVQLPDELTLPLAVVSCIPATGLKAGELNVCGIKTYTFGSKDNTAGWTSLTIGLPGGASQQEINDFFDTEGDAGRILFNEIVEKLETTPILENKFPPPLSPYQTAFDGCEGSIGTTVECGLGGEWEEPTSYQGRNAEDPLLRYYDGVLPRLITVEANELERLAFRDIVTQDQVLAIRDNEKKDQTPGPQAYQGRMADLYNGSFIGNIGGFTTTYPDIRAQLFDTGDEEVDQDNLDKYLARFIGNECNDCEDFIRFVKDSKDDFDHDGSTNDNVYVPDFNRVLDYAGYPPVTATTGTMTTVMDALLEAVAGDKKGSGDFRFTATTKDYPPFDENGDWPEPQGEGDTLKFTIPVIFAGACKGFFDPKSFATSNATIHENNELHYVGLANFLVTRILKGGQCYYTNENAVKPSGSSPPPGCTDESLGLTDTGEAGVLGRYICPEQFNPPGAIAFEGLIRPPGLGGDVEGVPSKVFLVE